MTKSIGYTDEVVTRIDIDIGVSTGIRWGSLSQDMVPIFEEHIARLERGYKINEWLEMDPMERAMVVAVRRIDNAMKNIQAEAEYKQAKKEAKK